MAVLRIFNVGVLAMGTNAEVEILVAYPRDTEFTQGPDLVAETASVERRGHGTNF